MSLISLAISALTLLFTLYQTDLQRIITAIEQQRSSPDVYLTSMVEQRGSSAALVIVVENHGAPLDIEDIGFEILTDDPDLQKMGGYRYTPLEFDEFPRPPRRLEQFGRLRFEITRYEARRALQGHSSVLGLIAVTGAGPLRDRAPHIKQFADWAAK